MKPEQITAWALGETSTAEREQFDTVLSDNPQVQQTVAETKSFCDFLLSELRDDSLALTEAQRKRLMTMSTATAVIPIAIPPVVTKELPRSKKWRTGTLVRLAVAACLAISGFWLWQALEQRRSDLATDSRLPSEPKFRVKADRDLRLVAENVAKNAMVEGAFGQPGGVRPVLPGLSGLPGGSFVTGGSLPSAPVPEPILAPSSPLGMNGGVTTMTTGDVAKLNKIQDQTAYGVQYAWSDTPDHLAQAAGSGTSSIAIGSFTPVPNSGVTITRQGQLSNDLSINLSLGYDTYHMFGWTADRSQSPTGIIGGFVNNPTSADPGGRADSVRGGLLMADSSLELGNYDTAISQYQEVLRVDPYNAASRRGMVQADKKKNEYFQSAYEAQRAKMLAQVDEAWETKLPMLASTDALYFGQTTSTPSRDSDGSSSRQVGERGSSTDSYQRIVENDLKEVAREPLSTFSIDVDTAAYANMRRFLNQGALPPPDAVRIEEMINYFPAAEEGPAPGAKEPFGVRVEMAPCPWQPEHRLARIAIKGRELGGERKPSNLVFLVDVSGSMGQPNKLPLVQQSLRMLTEQLGEGDRVSMVVYAGSSGLALPPTTGDKKSEIMSAIAKLKAGGGTHGSAGIYLAYEQAVAGFIKGGVNRVILCTDGDFNVGVNSPEELEKLIAKKAKSGVFLSVLGYGTGNLKDHAMETLADKGNGNYAYIDSLSEARKVLVEQMGGTLVTIAKDVKIQVEFNPVAVRSYRLVGYENRLLAKEDFNDDIKDAGEIGAGHSVVALYEVVPANLAPGTEPRPLVDNLRYQTNALAVVPQTRLADAAKTGEVMTVKLRYKEPDSSLSKLIEVPAKDEGKTLTASSEEFKFSAAVAGFGLLLRDSQYKGTLGWETVRKLALDGKGSDKLGYRGEFLQLIDKARGLKEVRQ